MSGIIFVLKNKIQPPLFPAQFQKVFVSREMMQTTVAELLALPTPLAWGQTSGLHYRDMVADTAYLRGVFAARTLEVV